MSRAGACPRARRAASPTGRPGPAAGFALAAVLGITGLASAAPLAVPATGSTAPATHPVTTALPATLVATWRQQFDDPVLTALLAPLAPQDSGRAQALAREWVAVRVFHAQWSTLNALAQLAQDQQAALMDLLPGAEGRETQLARVASQLEQARRLGTDRAARRDRAIDAVARLAGTAPEALVARIGQPLAEWRLPHLVAEPPTLRLTVSPGTSAQVQRLTDLHTRHQAALQADRAVLAARQRMAQAQAQAGSGDDAATAQPADPATAQAWQDLLLALNAQAGAAGDLALAWLDYLATAPAAGAGQAASRGAARPA